MALFSEIQEKLELQKILLATSPWVSPEAIERYRSLENQLAELAPEARQRPIRSTTRTKQQPTAKSTPDKKSTQKPKKRSPPKKKK